ncbi:hypothetical protein TNCV_3665251 [Trichonephila clavipes]|nr:hypothetical protein TNCV_3665251 [Trichonephila clavipes]
MPSVCQCPIKTHEIHHGKGLDSTPVVSRSYEHHVGDRAIWLVSTSILWENTLEMVRGFSHIFPFCQPLKRTCDRQLLRVLPCSRIHYTLANSHANSGIRIQALKHSSQWH